MENKTFNPVNIILIIAVAGLYYLHFSSNGAKGGSNGEDDSTAVVLPRISPTSIKSSGVVYINGDVIYEDYEYAKEISIAAKVNQSRLEKEYQQKAQSIQTEYTALQQKMSKGLLSENQSIAEQEALMKKKADLDNYELKMQELVQNFEKDKMDVHSSITDYLKEYNKTSQYQYILGYTNSPGGMVMLADDSLDITNEVLKGLNEQYKAKKTAKK
jgi:outer membrane protein